MSTESETAYEFGPFRFDRRTLMLSRDGVGMRLSPKASRLLLLLIEARGQMVSKDELLSALWPRTFVEEGNLTFQIHELRKALGDRKGDAIYIETIPRRGYRFVAPVTETRDDDWNVEPPSATAAPPLAIVEAETGDEDVAGERGGRWRWLPLLAVAGLAIAFVGLYLTTSQATPAPRVARYVQLTHDGVPKTSLLWYDGAHIAVHVPNRTLLLDLNTRRLLDAPVPEGYQLVDVSESRQEALAVRPKDRGAECALWVVPLKRGQPRRLGSICSSHAAWSPDGRQIAYASGTGLYETSPDGLVVRTLANFSGSPGYPRWSRDGRTIRFDVGVLSNRTLTSAIWEIQSDGTGLHKIIEGPGGEARECCGNWMPDGSGFAFESNRDGRHGIWLRQDQASMFGRTSWRLIELTHGPLDFFWPLPSRDRRWLYVIGKPAQGPMFQYNPAAHALEPHPETPSAWWIDYSPSGRQIAYISEPQHGLWVADADGSHPRQLAIAPVVDVDACAWSPDGKRIAFRGAAQDRHHKVYVIDVEGGSPMPLTTDDIEQGIATWSPDGTRLTFGDVPERFGQPTGSEAIHLYDLATGTDDTVPGSRGLWTSRWSPDGRYLAALTIQGQQLLLYEWTTRTWRPFNIDHVDNPWWSKDGRYLYFAPEGGVDRPLSRLRISDGAVEGLAAMNGPVAHWSGITPDDLPIMLAEDWDIYALDLTGH